MKLRNSLFFLSIIALSGLQALKACEITVTNDLHDTVHLKGHGTNSLSVSLKPHHSFTVKTGNREQTHFHVVTHDHQSYKVQENFCKALGNKLNVSKIIKLSALSPATAHEQAHRFSVQPKALAKKDAAKHVVQHHLKAMKHQASHKHHHVPNHNHQVKHAKHAKVQPIHSGPKARHAHHQHAGHHNHGKKA